MSANKINIIRQGNVSLFLGVFLVSCSSLITPIPYNPDTAITQAVGTVNAQLTQTALGIGATDSTSKTSTPEATAIRTPPTLPPIYQSPLLNPLDIPHTYLEDTCNYLKLKWDPHNSPPGTIVMVIMFHSIVKGEASDLKDINTKDFQKMMAGLKDQGFEAIYMQQLADFLELNSLIPMRSVVLIQDDRHFAENFNDHFRPYWEQWGWPVVNAWISHPETTQDLWNQNAQLAAEGWVDYQAHGVIHNINMSDQSSDEFLRSELQGSITSIQQHFNKTPIAIIWPGGGFGFRPVQMARQLGYHLGFTINPRGPIMFDWIPLADVQDSARPYYIPEGPIGDPLLTLPRYWPSQVLSVLDQVRVISKEMVAFAEKNRSIELEYYDILCSQTYGAIPPILK